MRFYLFKVAYNKVACAEDRPQPPAYNSYDEAKKAQYQYMGQSVLGETIGWAMTKIICENGVCNASDDTYWESPTIVQYYGDLIVAGTINTKTNEPWKLEDVSDRWRDAVAEYVRSHTPEEPVEESVEEQNA
jgi:hypothetical protein